MFQTTGPVSLPGGRNKIYTPLEFKQPQPLPFWPLIIQEIIFELVNSGLVLITKVFKKGPVTYDIKIIYTFIILPQKLISMVIDIHSLSSRENSFGFYS